MYVFAIQIRQTLDPTQFYCLNTIRFHEHMHIIEKESTKIVLSSYHISFDFPTLPVFYICCNNVVGTSNHMLQYSHTLYSECNAYSPSRLCSISKYFQL